MKNKSLNYKKILIYFSILCIVSFSIFLTFNLKNNKIKSENLTLDLIAENLVNPVYLVETQDNSGRLFVVDRVGVIRIIDSSGNLLKEPFLDLRDKMVELRSAFDERGLLGLAFHPEFSENGNFYVYYSAPLRENGPEEWDHTSTISEFKTSENENKADESSERIILQIDEPQFNHNAGQLLFGNDNYLYIAVGDGGQANDVGLGHPEVGNGQDTSTLLGSILRIDVNGETYSIPRDNPFVGKQGRDEIYAYGLRNPFRMSFDKETGLLFVGDVGQNLWEEVNIVEKGKNYGWNIKEGAHCFDKNNPDVSLESCSDTGYFGEELINPIIEYNHSMGISIIGGFVYRGKEIPELNGKYIFGDWSSGFTNPNGIIFIGEQKNNNWIIANSFSLSSFVLGFGEDLDGELYVLTSNSVGPTGNSGKVYKVVKK